MDSLLALVIAINAARVNMQPLYLSPKLTKAAELRADYLCARKQFSHDNFRPFLAMVKYTYGGENLFCTTNGTDCIWYGTPDLQKAHEMLLKSPTHYENIVKREYTRVGIAARCGLLVELFSN